MTLETLIRCIGVSHLLQPPLTLLLAKQLGLERDFARLPPLSAQVARNMGFASVALPTSAGLVVALGARDVVAGGPMVLLAWTMAAFWTWRLSRQRALGPLLPRTWHWGLCAIFCVQGPLFAAVLSRAAAGR
jgi:hypothetical protein